MAAKYLNPDKDTVRGESCRRRTHGSCSGSAGGVSDDFRPFTTCYGFRFYRFAHCREELRFNTAVGSSYQMGTNTIAACISENQTIEQGGRVRLRLLQPLQAGSITVPENSLVTGAAVIQGERLDILISSIEYAGNIIPVQLATYDIDGQKGISFPDRKPAMRQRMRLGRSAESMGKQRIIRTFCRTAGGHGPDARSHAGRHAVDCRAGPCGQGDAESRI